MLTIIREKTQGIIATFILALVGIPFALWGVNSYLDGGVRSDVASVNGQKISEQEYRSAYEGFRRQLDPRMGDSPEFKQAVIGRLVDQVLFGRDAQNQGYRVGNERLSKVIGELPFVQNNGRFDTALYQGYLRQRGMSARQFEEQLREDVIANQIQFGFSTSAITTDAELTTLLRLLKQERDVAYTVISGERFLAGAKITPEAIQQYYGAHPELFRTQEQVRIEYIRLSAQALVKDHKPTDAELRQLYTEDASRVRPESRRVSHILITVASPDDDKKALNRVQEIEKQARAGDDFSKLARAHSQDTESAVKGGDLGEVRPGVLPKLIEEAVLSLKQGELTKPIRTEYGYHLVKLTAYKPASQKSFDEMRPQLVKQWYQRHSEERYYEASEKFRNIVYEQADTLAPAAEALGLKIETSDWFGRTGGTGIAAHPRVIETAFSAEVLQQKRNSDAFDISADSLISVRVVGHRPAELKPLNEVGTLIERILKQEAVQRAAREQGESLIRDLAAGQSLDVLVRKQGLSMQGPKIVLRDQLQGLDPTLVDAAFRVARPEKGKVSFGGVDLGSKGYAIYAVTQVRDGDPAKIDAATKEKAKRLLAAQRGAGYFADYRASLKQKAAITIHQERL